MLGVAVVLTITTAKFALQKEDNYQIRRPSEYRIASGELLESEEIKEAENTSDVHVATEIGFNDIEIDEKLKIEDSTYQNELIEYVVHY